jgi:lysophospholipase L1-like esterase
VFLAGTNDIAGNLGPVSMESIENNLAAMADIARANGIKVVMASVMPVCDYHRPQTAQRPPEKIKELNAWIRATAEKNAYVYVDYYTPMLDDKGFLKAEITGDGLHPNAAGYQIMAPLAEQAIAKALGK